MSCEAATPASFALAIPRGSTFRQGFQAGQSGEPVDMTGCLFRAKIVWSDLSETVMDVELRDDPLWADLVIDDTTTAALAEGLEGKWALFVRFPSDETPLVAQGTAVAQAVVFVPDWS